MSKLRGVIVALVAGGAIAWAATGRSSRPEERSPAAGEETAAHPVHSFTRPPRSEAHAPPQVVIPEVPAELASAPRLTAEIETRVGRRRTALQRKTVTRSPDRVHISLGPNGPEWLFVRNPRDGRRMSATLIDGERKVLIEYDESELRNGGLGRGWADVVGLGVEPELLARLEPTGRVRTIAGHRAIEKRLPAGASGPVRQLWWSDEAAAPLRVTIEDGASSREIRVRSLKLHADESLLRDPRERYPDHAVMDVADHREKHHEKAHQRRADRSAHD